MLPNLAYLVEQIGKERGIPKELIIETLEEAMLKAAQKKYGADGDIEAHFNEEIGEVELFQFKTVVKEVTDPELEIEEQEALQLDPDAMEGDDIGIKLDNQEFGRIAAQVAKQVIIQRVRAAERENVYNDYKDRKGELIAGTVRRVERGNLIVDLGRTEAILLAKDQSPRETYRPHDRILAYVVDVSKTTRGPQIVLSRTDIGLLIKLFEMEVPEISEGIVQIVNASRDPGSRSKIAVMSKDQDVDPVGACVGMKGTRVQNIVQELRGEKIDIVPYSEDPVRYVCAALQPAQVSSVLIDEEEHQMEITVPDDQLSLAIGKRGLNVRLASQLSGWKIDIQSESKVEKMAEVARHTFQLMDGVDAELADTLTKLGFLTLEDIVRADLDDLSIIPGLNATLAEEMVKKADDLYERIKDDPTLNMTIEDPSRTRNQKPAKMMTIQPPSAREDDGSDLMRIKGMDEDVAIRLQEAGYYTLMDLAGAAFEAQDFADKFEVSLRKARNILHSVKQKTGAEDEQEPESVEESAPTDEQTENVAEAAEEGSEAETE